MALETIIVSRDWQEISVLECVLGSLHMGARVESDVERARSRFGKTKVDAVIVDRDLDGTERFLSSLKSTRNSCSVPLVLMSGARNGHDLPLSGATFYFEKPISVEEAVRTLSAARNMVLNGRLRYHREPLKVPVSLCLDGHKSVNGRLTNLSQGGIGVWAAHSFDTRGAINVAFDLPEISCSVHAMGEVAWTDNAGNAGIRFLDLPEPMQRNLQLWLEKRYFAQ